MSVLAWLPEEELPATGNNHQTSFFKELPHFTAGVQAPAGEGAAAAGGMHQVPGL